MASSTTNTDPAQMLPLTHLTYHIMIAVRDGAQHGYAIMKRVDDLSGGRITPGTGTFYSALRRMLEEGTLVEVEEPSGVEGHDARRRYYELTAFGRDVLAAERSRLSDLLKASGPEPGVVG